MIISHSPPLIFISTPGCGTHSMFELLESTLGGFRAFGDAGYHNRLIPNDFDREGYELFTTVRNPVDRLISAWTQCFHQNLRVRATWLKNTGGDHSLAAFASWCADHVDELQHPRKDWPYALKATPLGVWHQDTGVERFLHIENIDTELAAFLGETLKDQVPRLNVHRRPPGELVDEAAAVEIRRWAGEDFERFGYSQIGQIGSKDDGEISHDSRSNME